MGARSVPHPAPGPGAAPGSIAAARLRPSRAPNDPEPVPGPQVHTLGALEDVTDATPRKEQPAGPNRPYRPHDEFAIQQCDRDRDAHPERVDRTGAIEQEHVVGAHRRTAAPTAHTFATRLGQLRSEDLGTRTEQPDQSHRTTLAPGGDILGGRSVRSFDRWGKIGPRETRVKAPSQSFPSRSPSRAESRRTTRLAVIAFTFGSALGLPEPVRLLVTGVASSGRPPAALVRSREDVRRPR